MIKLTLLSSIIVLILTSTAICQDKPSGPVQVMTLGTFHFAYPNLDVIKTSDEDQINVLNEPWQSEIVSIAKAIEDFKPTIIAVERNPSLQHRTDSLYNEYRAGRYTLKKNEIDQLGFRIAADMNLDRVYCVDDMGRHYQEVLEIMSDSIRMAAFSDYYMNPPTQNVEAEGRKTAKVNSITGELMYLNQPEVIKDGLASYLVHPFLYEENPGDFTGVDFETGRWFNRNLRILRNVQRIPATPNDRILLIIGSEHLNLLNFFFEVASGYDLVSPLPFLEGVSD